MSRFAHKQGPGRGQKYVHMVYGYPIGEKAHLPINIYDGYVTRYWVISFYITMKLSVSFDIKNSFTILWKKLWARDVRSGVFFVKVWRFNASIESFRAIIFLYEKLTLHSAIFIK